MPTGAPEEPQIISDSFWKILGEWLRTEDSKKAATVQWMYCSVGTK